MRHFSNTRLNDSKTRCEFVHARLSMRCTVSQSHSLTNKRFDDGLAENVDKTKLCFLPSIYQNSVSEDASLKRLLSKERIATVSDRRRTL